MKHRLACVFPDLRRFSNSCGVIGSCSVAFTSTPATRICRRGPRVGKRHSTASASLYTNWRTAIKSSNLGFFAHLCSVEVEKRLEMDTIFLPMSRPRRAPKKHRRATVNIHDVAKRARVSIATVSRAVNRLSTVDPELAKRVWKAVDEVGYVPNTQARALVSGRSRILGLIVSEITNPFFPELVQEFENLAVTQGYEVMIGPTNYDTARTKSLIRRMLQRNVDGVAVMTFGIEEDGQKARGARVSAGLCGCRTGVAQHPRSESELRRGDSRGSAAFGRARPSPDRIHYGPAAHAHCCHAPQCVPQIDGRPGTDRAGEIYRRRQPHHGGRQGCHGEIDRPAANCPPR